jgi:hypothetical protein
MIAVLAGLAVIAGCACAAVILGRDAGHHATRARPDRNEGDDVGRHGRRALDSGRMPPVIERVPTVSQPPVAEFREVPCPPSELPTKMMRARSPDTPGPTMRP